MDHFMAPLAQFAARWRAQRQTKRTDRRSLSRFPLTVLTAMRTREDDSTLPDRPDPSAAHNQEDDLDEGEECKAAAEKHRFFLEPLGAEGVANEEVVPKWPPADQSSDCGMEHPENFYDHDLFSL